MAIPPPAFIYLPPILILQSLLWWATNWKYECRGARKNSQNFFVVRVATSLLCLINLSSVMVYPRMKQLGMPRWPGPRRPRVLPYPIVICRTDDGTIYRFVIVIWGWGDNTRCFYRLIKNHSEAASPIISRHYTSNVHLYRFTWNGSIFCTKPCELPMVCGVDSRNYKIPWW